MPGPWGESARHISRVFGQERNRAFLSQLEELEFFIDTAWQATPDLAAQPADVFHLPIADLPFDVRQQARQRFREALQFDEVAAEIGTPVEMPRMDDSSRPYARYQLPPTDEPVTAHRLAFDIQSFQIEEGAEGVPSRFDVTGRQLRPSVLQRHTEMINEGIGAAQTRMVFDVETTGTGRQADIWQIAARRVDEHGRVHELNTLFDTNRMLGEFGPEGETLADFYQQRHGPARFLRDPTERRAALRQFLEMAEQSEQWVGHNVAFDVEQVGRMLRRELAGDEADMARVNAFIQQAQGRAVDTRILAGHFLGEIGIDPAVGKPLAMENIMLRTSLIEDIETRLGPDFADEFVTEDLLRRAQGHGGRAAVLGRLEAGMHAGHIDVMFEEHFLRSLQERQLDPSSGALRVLTDEEALGQGNVSPLRGRFRDLIAESGPLVPTEPIPGRGLTPVQQMVVNARQGGLGVVDNVTREHVMQAGDATRWLRNVFAGDALNLADMPGLRGLAFGGLSPIERTVSGLLGQHVNERMGRDLQQVRQRLGGGLGTGIFRGRTDEARTYGRRALGGDGRIAALPTEFLAHVEQEGILSTHFTRPDVADEVPMARLSLIDYVDRTSGDRMRDIALVGDISQDDAGRLAAHIRNLTEEQRGRFGFRSAQHAEEVAETVGQFGHQYGLQLGILGQEDQATTRRLAQVMGEIGADVDTGAHRLQVPILPASEAISEQVAGPHWVTGPAMIDVEGHELSQEMLRQHQRGLSELQDESMRLAREEPRVLRYAEETPFARRALEVAQNMGRNWRTVGLGLGGLFVGAHLLRRSRDPERQAAQDPFHTQPIEPGTEQIRPDRTQIPPRSQQRLSRHDHTGTVSALHRQRTGHHAMGNRRHEHLF